jgi:Flp pilus assembly protein TadG
MIGDERGSAAVTTIVLLPLLLIVLTAALELGALRAITYRASAAADLATLVAVNDQDETEHVRTGGLLPSADAEQVARSYFALNLAPSAPALADPIEAIAAAADIAVFRESPATDAVTGWRYERPTVRLIARVPVRTPAFHALLLPSITTVIVRAASSAR